VHALDLRDVEVVQLHGGYRIIQAPLAVASRELPEQLAREPGIAETLRLGAEPDLALFGVGSNRPRISSLVRTGYLTAAESQRLLESGAVGTVCGLHIDARGRPFPCDWNERLVGIAAASLLRILRLQAVPNIAQPRRAKSISKII
jgi:DNA-binding transcriptional regulator LsrR (DeoR family)